MGLIVTLACVCGLFLLASLNEFNARKRRKLR
jgi:hypothetical protein